LSFFKDCVAARDIVIRFFSKCLWLKLHFLAVILLAAASFASCAGRDFASLRKGIETRGHYIQGVPFYKQSEDTCGPAALAALLTFWGRQANLEEITAKVYLQELRGTLPMDMESYARASGFDTSSFSGTLDGLKEYIRKGLPVICLLDLGFWVYHQPHYVTVIGFDDGNALIIEHDGLKPDSLMSYRKFSEAWSRAGFWMLVITPKPGEAKP
jgi:ABC-type bacteriocin/lantibiotic exporter with double-glycine peptidase domain